MKNLLLKTVSWEVGGESCNYFFSTPDSQLPTHVLEIQPFLPGGLCQGFNPAVVEKPVSVENNFLNLVGQRLFGDERPDFLGRFGLALPEILPFNSSLGWRLRAGSCPARRR
jgi:hypothetical protein